MKKEKRHFIRLQGEKTSRILMRQIDFLNFGSSYAYDCSNSDPK